MPESQAARDLLIGIVAYQMGIVDRDRLMAVMRTWVADKSQSFQEVMRRHVGGVDDPLEFVTALVDWHLQQEGRVGRALESLSSVGSLLEDLRSLDDEQLNATLSGFETPSGNREPTMGFEPGAHVPSDSEGRFRILRPHARGGLGVVSVAYDQELHREVALKEIHEKYAYDTVSRSRFMLEAEINGGLEHPGIVPVYSLGQDGGGRPFYAMRFIRGDSLAEAIRDVHQQPDAHRDEQKRQLRRLLGGLVDVCNAVEYAHSRGVLHRDLKPGNIMLGKYGETLVVDWGLAKAMGRPDPHANSDEKVLEPSSGDDSTQTVMGSQVGTPQYMSPEQAEGRLDLLGPATDVYSLGATMYCLLTGGPPFAGEDRVDLIRRVQRGEFPRPRQKKADIPRALESICLQAMALRQADRYPSPRVLADDIERWLGDESVSVYREPWLDRAVRGVRHHRTAAATATVFLLSAVVALAVIAGVTRSKNNQLAAARDVARTSAETAARERDRAAGNLTVSRELALELLDVAESRLSRIPGQGAARRQMTDDTLRVFKQFYDQQPRDPSVRRELAQVYRVWGNVVREDDLPAAIAANAESVALLESLVADQQDDTLSRDRLAETVRDQAALLQRVGRLGDSQAAYTRGLAVIAELRAEHADNTNYLRTEATLQLDLASLQSDLGRLDQALANANSAALSFRTLTAGSSLYALDPLLRLLSMRSQGELLRLLNRLDEADTLLEEAWQFSQTLDPNSPSNLHFQARVRFEQSLVHALKSSAEDDAGARERDESIGIWRRLVDEWRDSPRIGTYRRYLAIALTQRATSRLDANQLEAAGTDLEEALGILQLLASKAPDDLPHREAMATTFFQLSRLALALDQRDLAVQRQARAIELQQQLVDTSPEHVVWRQRLESFQRPLPE